TTTIHNLFHLSISTRRRETLKVNRSPAQIPRGGSPIGFPLSTEAFQSLRLRQFSFAVSDLVAFAHAKVVDGQHIRPAQVEHEEHLGRPTSHAFDGGEMFNDFRIG